jgi:hypothetical protein
MTTTLAPKDPDVEAPYAIDWHDQLVLPADRRLDVAVGQFLRYPHIDTGFYYEVTQAGRLAQFFPQRLPRAEGEEVADGSAILEAVSPANATLTAIETADWTLPDGITLASQQIAGFRTIIRLSGGEDGVDYDLTCRITPSAGDELEQTITIPVRAQ